MIRILWAIALLVCSTSCAPQPEASSPCGPTSFQVLREDTHDAVFRASTARLWSESNRLGTAFLYNSPQGLKIGTIAHVANLSYDSCAYLAMSGSDVMLAIRWSSFEFNGPSTDQFASYTLPEAFTQHYYQQIQQSELQSLVLAKQPPTLGETVLIPMKETGTYASYHITSKNSSGEWMATADSEQERVCQGQSGTPVLRSNQGNPTLEVIGVLSSIIGFPFPEPDYRGRLCSTTIVFTPVQ